MSEKLTRSGARDVTSTIDRLASLIQEQCAVLGIDPRIAKDYALRSDMISDAIERTAAINFPLKEAANEEGMSLPNDGWDADQIADKVPGALESDADEPYMGTFTEEEHHELGERQEGGQLENGVKAASDTHGFNLFA
jgi:hypothetical protein